MWSEALGVLKASSVMISRILISSLLIVTDLLRARSAILVLLLPEPGTNFPR